uniref:Uncharacterized protein n=1 Tax=Peromyscus maniculatus bairdii TaxID=230844 RepID=A0A8C8UAY2_PERMB
MAAQAELQVQLKLVLSSCETLIWSLMPCLFLPRLRWSRTQLWQHSMSVI